MFLTVYETSNFPHFYLHRMIFECLFPTKSEKKITNIANRILFNLNFLQETNVRESLQKNYHRKKQFILLNRPNHLRYACFSFLSGFVVYAVAAVVIMLILTWHTLKENMPSIESII